MKFILLVCAGFLFGAIAQANTIRFPNELSQLPCSGPIRTLIGKHIEVQHWLANPEVDGVQSWVGLGSDIEKQVRVLKQRNTSTISILSRDIIFHYTFSPKDCAPAGDMQKLSAAPPNTFSDQHLKDILRHSKQQKTVGVIYLWSPRMHLSWQGLKEIRIAAKDHGVEFFAAADGTLTQSEIDKIAKTQGLPPDSNKRNTSRFLASLKSHQHYPSMLLYKEGQVLFPLIPGLNTKEQFATRIQSAFGNRSKVNARSKNQ